MNRAALTSQQLVDACACTRLRTAARLVTRAYDEALRAAGVNASQLAVLAAVDVDDATSIAALSKRLAMDRTTLGSRRLEKEQDRAHNQRGAAPAHGRDAAVGSSPDEFPQAFRQKRMAAC